MDVSASRRLRVGSWNVDPMASAIYRGGEAVRLEARTLRLLLFLAENAGKVVSIDDLLENVWAGVIVTQDSVYQAVASIRRTLGDDPRQPTYIATVPRQGYRLVAPVSEWVDEPLPSEPHAVAAAAPAPAPNRNTQNLTLAITAFTVLLLASLLWLRPFRPTSPPINAEFQHSIAVLPFLDLTSESMEKEYFADGLTEELIDKLSKIPGLRVPAPTASFYFKGQHMTPKEIAGRLNVAYLLDGSIRKSDTSIRIAARLLRADTGFVVWSETYNRAAADELVIQDDIATQVAKALRASVGGASAP